jgi:hypothetical protein
MVLINNYFRGMLGTPFGGTKHSGHGREHAIQTLQDFVYTQDDPLPQRHRHHPRVARRHRDLRQGQLISFTRSRDLADHSQKGQVACQQTLLNPTQSG